MSNRCGHGHDKQHLVNYWWQNNSVAGASWCDGQPDGQRIENLEDAPSHIWVAELQALGEWVSTGDHWNDGHWVALQPVPTGFVVRDDVDGPIVAEGSYLTETDDE